jgi:hypothetical protein
MTLQSRGFIAGIRRIVECASVNKSYGSLEFVLFVFLVSVGCVEEKLKTLMGGASQYYSIWWWC